MKKHKFTYENSGVNINAADKFVKYIANLNKKKKSSTNNNNIGSFASITKIPKGIKKPLLVSSTDGVGTKIEIANKLKKFDTIGEDLVAMCVNDILVQGARPLIFLVFVSLRIFISSPSPQPTSKILEFFSMKWDITLNSFFIFN